jgi:hypothetical protein
VAGCGADGGGVGWATFGLISAPMVGATVVICLPASVAAATECQHGRY